MIESDEYLYGMNRQKIDMEKAYDIISDAPNSESNAVINVWKARFADPRWRQCKSSRIKAAEQGDAYAQHYLDRLT